MSFDSSDLLSEGSQSHVQDEAVNDAPFSFHGYLDEVAGIADSGIDTDMEEEEDEEEEEEAAVEENNDVVKDSHDIKNNHNDVLMLFNESGLSYDESVQQDTTDRSSALIPMTTGDNDIEKEKDKLSKSAASTTVGVVIQNMDSHPVGSDAHTSGVIIDTATLQPPPFMIDEESLQNIKDMKGTIVHSPPHIKNVASLHDAMSPDSVQSPSKNQSPLPIKKVRMSPLVKTEIFKRHLETPPRKGKSFESRSDSNNNESKKPKTISPFSPTARKLRLKQLSSAIGMQHQSQSQSQPPQLKWSMAPSRKVSILVNVSPRLDAPISSNDEESKLCLYPNVVAEDTGNFHGSIAYSPAYNFGSTKFVRRTHTQSF